MELVQQRALGTAEINCWDFKILKKKKKKSLCPFLPLALLLLQIKKAFIKERSNHPEVQTERIQEENYLYLDVRTAVKYITLSPPLPLQLC